MTKVSGQVAVGSDVEEGPKMVKVSNSSLKKQISKKKTNNVILKHH